MINFTELNKDNYIFFAIQNYDNPRSSTKDEFYEDLGRLKYIQRHLKKYVTTGSVKIPLLLNHFIVLYNVFGEAATALLFYKSDSSYWSAIKTFLIYLNRYPNKPSDSLNCIPVDYQLFTQLKEV
jgi:hypothetical protein